MLLRVALVQIGTGYDKTANVNKVLNALDSISQMHEKPNLICLPELFTVRRVEEVKSGLGKYAETIPGRLSQELSGRAKKIGCILVAGSFVEVAEGRFYNTCLAFDGSGELIAKYRKTHLFDAPGGHSESSVLTPGDNLTVVDTEFGKIGLMICYELRFPEAARTLALMGATMLCVPNSWPIDHLNMASDQLRILLQGTALQNQLYLIHANQFGTVDSDLDLCGRSCVVDPSGQIIAQAPDQECTVHTIIDTDLVEKVRRTRLTFSHRRPELYRT